jgi:hypothetical protein
MRMIDQYQMPNQAAPVNAPIALWLQFPPLGRRVTEQRRWAAAQAMRSAITYYPKAMLLERRIRWCGIPICLVACVALLLFGHGYTLQRALGVGFLSYAALWFGVSGLFTLGAEGTLLFDSQRRDAAWSVWYSILSALIGICFLLAATAWVWLLFRA